ncbi:hypothetical protein A2T98_11175 [Nodularia spumigena CENA596]|uniref:Uncharacterized protein n=1 Tax=Nodularia spumigena CENA596 TaxID=1819295 RepID=A0A166JHQ4_NODSP|nr:hypothetical protein A2T98_11175 [Nodularia spumigena CENA596]
MAEWQGGIFYHEPPNAPPYFVEGGDERWVKISTFSKNRFALGKTSERTVEIFTLSVLLFTSVSMA